MRYPILVTALTLLAACSGSRPTPAADRAEAPVAAEAASPQGYGLLRARDQLAPGSEGKVAGRPVGGAADTAAIPSMLIRNGQAWVEVESLEPAIAAVRALAGRVGGFVANSSFEGGREQRRTATLQLRIPASRLDEALGGLAPIGEVTSLNVTAEDVGEEFVDVTARLANSRRLEDRLVTLLATRTGKLEDVLAVERELARVREEIERTTGRLRYLRRQVALSTLAVTVAEPAPLVAHTPGRNVIVDAFRQAWRNAVGVVAGGIALLGALVPLAGVAALVWLGWRRLRRR